MDKTNSEQSKEKLISSENDADNGRHFLAVFFLSFLWGPFGVDRFYLGKVGTGLLKLISFGGFGLWVIIDLVLIMSGSMYDKEGRPMREAARYKKFAVHTVVIFAVVLGLVTLITGGILLFVIYQLVSQLLIQGPETLQQFLPPDLLPTDLNSLSL